MAFSTDQITITGTGSLSFPNNSTIREGLIPHGFGGGISRVCANSKEDQWEDGFKYLISTTGGFNTVVYTENINNVNPSDNDDETLSYAVGSRWKNLISGVEYICTDATTGAAVWQAQSGTYTPTLDNALGAVTSVGGVSFAFFTVSGNVCTVTINGAIAVDFSSLDSGDFTFTLPIPSSTPTAIGVVNLNVPNQVNGVVGGRIKLFSNDTTFDTATNSIEFTAVFQYLITI
jgi:hypothetical protein